MSYQAKLLSLHRSSAAFVSTELEDAFERGHSRGWYELRVAAESITGDADAEVALLRKALQDIANGAKGGETAIRALSARSFCALLTTTGDDEMTTDFEKAYQRLFRLRGADTKHMNDCELVWQSRDAEITRLQARVKELKDELTHQLAWEHKAGNLDSQSHRYRQMHAVLYKE